MSPKKSSYENLAESLIEKFNLRKIESYYAETKEEALEMAKSYLTPGCAVSWGGSETLKEIGLISYLKESQEDYILYDRSQAGSEEEKRQMYGKIVTSDVFFLSSNAITLEGELVNIDGAGNRVACLAYGPETVVVVAGMNKVVGDAAQAVDRVRNIAAPPNCIRLGLKTPCSQTGYCRDCFSKDCICSHIVITRYSRIPNRIKVILVGEELGF